MQLKYIKHEKTLKKITDKMYTGKDRIFIHLRSQYMLNLISAAQSMTSTQFSIDVYWVMGIVLIDVYLTTIYITFLLHNKAENILY